MIRNFDPHNFDVMMGMDLMVGQILSHPGGPIGRSQLVLVGVVQENQVWQ